MKTKIFSLLLALCLALGALASCGTVTPTPTPPATCTQHKDQNHDLKCDSCGAAVACTEHADEDQDLKCDYCQADLPCEIHIDEDGDGFVDGTNIPYDDVVERGGVADEASRKNLNQVAPPSVISITKNNNAKTPGKCRFSIYDTSKYCGVSGGGFFGSTRFVTDENTYLGTDFANQDTETFRFIEPFEIIKKKI